MTKAEGEKFNFEDISKINSEFLQTFEFESKDQYIKTETNEFSAVCPFSGLPDISYVKIEYFPTGGKCVELKSLKYYFVSFRNVGIYQEAATKRIYDDLKILLDTKILRQVFLLIFSRVGISSHLILIMDLQLVFMIDQ